MPFLYEIEETLSDGKRCEVPARTCMMCARSEVGELDSDGKRLVVGFCPKYVFFMSEADLLEDKTGECCFE